MLKQQGIDDLYNLCIMKRVYPKRRRLREKNILRQDLEEGTLKIEYKFIPCSSTVEQDPVKIEVRGSNPLGGA